MDLINKILKYKVSYFIILLFIILHLLQENKIIDFPDYLNYIIFGFSFIFLFTLNLKFSKKKQEKNLFYYLFEYTSLIIFSIILSATIKIPLNIAIINATSGIKHSELCEINNFISGRNQKLYFQFNNKKESIYYQNENHLLREEIIKNYQLKISYKNSIFGTKVIEDYELIIK